MPTTPQALSITTDGSKSATPKNKRSKIASASKPKPPTSIIACCGRPSPNTPIIPEKLFATTTFTDFSNTKSTSSARATPRAAKRNGSKSPRVTPEIISMNLPRTVRAFCSPKKVTPCATSKPGPFLKQKNGSKTPKPMAMKGNFSGTPSRDLEKRSPPMISSSAWASKTSSSPQTAPALPTHGPTISIDLSVGSIHSVLSAAPMRSRESPACSPAKNTSIHQRTERKA